MSELLESLSSQTPSAVPELRRLGRNLQGYHGETIDIRQVLEDCRAAARDHGWTEERLPACPGLDLLAFHRVSRSARARPLRVYVSAGIHGDEPAGPLAVRQLLVEDRFPRPLDAWVCPCLNPTGFDVNRRENARGTDLNRQYLQPNAEEIIAHIAWLQRQPRFDLCLCLHEDWEAHGFYLYELNPDALPSMAEQIIAQAAEVCPIDRSELIDGRPALAGIIRPPSDTLLRPQWPEAFFLVMHKTRLSYTLEAPSDFPMSARVAALTAATRAALDRLRASADAPQSP